jgi:signal transduction histidine kinase
LAALVQAVAETARARTTKHALRARTVGPVVASVDPIRISQVVAHLVDNAIRFSPDGGPIELDLTASSPDAALLRVTDHGIGIPVADRVHLFERFAPTRHAGYLSGIGLGLYVCRRICELHGGSLHAEFPDQGGTCFVITLPRSGGTERP